MRVASLAFEVTCGIKFEHYNALDSIWLQTSDVYGSSLLYEPNSHASVVWSIGAILFHLICGKSPFQLIEAPINRKAMLVVVTVCLIFSYHLSGFFYNFSLLNT